MMPDIDALIAVFADCPALGQWAMYDSVRHEYCALGWLGHAVDKVGWLGHAVEKEGQHSTWVVVKGVVMKRFDISEVDIIRLAQLNDAYEGTAPDRAGYIRSVLQRWHDGESLRDITVQAIDLEVDGRRVLIYDPRTLVASE